MDRFIGKAAVMYIWQFGVFKIQYGQIYRLNVWESAKGADKFKIQYGQIYSTQK